MTDSRRTYYAHPLRIYWEDTDAGGVVFYANYLKFFERARTEWLRSLGFEQEILRAESATMFVVSQTQIRYLVPARLDDMLNITVDARKAGRASMEISQVAWRGSERLAEGDIRIACVQRKADGTFKPCRIPNQILESLQ